MVPDPDNKKLKTIKESMDKQLLWHLVYATAGEEEEKEESDGSIQRSSEQRKVSNGGT